MSNTRLLGLSIRRDFSCLLDSQNEERGFIAMPFHKVPVDFEGELVYLLETTLLHVRSTDQNSAHSGVVQLPISVLFGLDRMLKL